MTQQSGARSPREDEDRAHETSGLVQGGHGTRAEEWRDPEPSAEDQPVEGATLGAEDRRGTPDGMTPDDVQERSDIARYLGTSAFPGTRDELRVKVEEIAASGITEIAYQPMGPDIPRELREFKAAVTPV